MNNYNPMGLRIDSQGVIRDKYGRPMEFDSKDFKQPAAKAVRPI